MPKTISSIFFIVFKVVSGPGWCYGTFSNAVSFDERARVLYGGVFSLTSTSYFIFWGSLNIELWVNMKSMCRRRFFRKLSDVSYCWVTNPSGLCFESETLLKYYRFYESYSNYEFHNGVYMCNLFLTLSCIEFYLLQMTDCSFIIILI